MWRLSQYTNEITSSSSLFKTCKWIVMVLKIYKFSHKQEKYTADSIVLTVTTLVLFAQKYKVSCLFSMNMCGRRMKYLITQHTNHYDIFGISSSCSLVYTFFVCFCHIMTKKRQIKNVQKHFWIRVCRYTEVRP